MAHKTNQCHELVLEFWPHIAQVGLKDQHIQSFIVGLVPKRAFQRFLKPFTALNRTYDPPAQTKV